MVLYGTLSWKKLEGVPFCCWLIAGSITKLCILSLQLPLGGSILNLNVKVSYFSIGFSEYRKVWLSQITTNFFVNHKCGDMFRLIESSSGWFVNHIWGAMSKSAHFWDPKMFTSVGECGYKWCWYCHNNIYIKNHPCVFLKSVWIGNPVTKIIKYNGIDTYIKVENGPYVSNILLKDIINAVAGVIILMFNCSLLSNQGTFWGKCHPSPMETK